MLKNMDKIADKLTLGLAEISFEEAVKKEKSIEKLKATRDLITNLFTMTNLRIRELEGTK